VDLSGWVGVELGGTCGGILYAAMLWGGGRLFMRGWLL